MKADVRIAVRCSRCGSYIVFEDSGDKINYGFSDGGTPYFKCSFSKHEHEYEKFMKSLHTSRDDSAEGFWCQKCYDGYEDIRMRYNQEREEALKNFAEQKLYKEENQNG